LPNLLFLTHLAKLYPSHDTHVNWKKYNESLVKRGEVLFGFDVIDNWDTEFEKMNECKKAGNLYIQIHLSRYWDT